VQSTDGECSRIARRGHGPQRQSVHAKPHAKKTVQDRL